MKGKYVMGALKEAVAEKIKRRGPFTLEGLRSELGINPDYEHDRKAVWALSAALTQLQQERSVVNLNGRYFSLEVNS